MTLGAATLVLLAGTGEPALADVIGFYAPPHAEGEAVEQGRDAASSLRAASAAVLDVSGPGTRSRNSLAEAITPNPIPVPGGQPTGPESDGATLNLSLPLAPAASTSTPAAPGSPVPEPQTVVLVAAGMSLVAIGPLMRRARKPS